MEVREKGELRRRATEEYDRGEGGGQEEVKRNGADRGSMTRWWRGGKWGVVRGGHGQ